MSHGWVAELPSAGKSGSCGLTAALLRGDGQLRCRTVLPYWENLEQQLALSGTGRLPERCRRAGRGAGKPIPAARFPSLTAGFHHFQRSPNSGRTREQQLSARRCASRPSPSQESRAQPRNAAVGHGLGVPGCPSVVPELRDLPAGVSVPPPSAAVGSAQGSPLR